VRTSFIDNDNLFADNTVVIDKNKNMIELQKEVNQELGIIDEWMKYNKFSLNYIKISYFVYTFKICYYIMGKCL